MRILRDSQDERGGTASDPALADLQRSLDALGAAERSEASSGFEQRLASATFFTLASASSTTIASTRIGKRFWHSPAFRLAAAVAVAAVGVVGWMATRNAPGSAGSSGAVVALSGSGGAGAKLSTDDAELYSLVTTALDGGAGSDIDLLFNEASELDSRIGATSLGASGESDQGEGSIL